MFSWHHRKKNSLEDLIDEIPVRCMSYIFDRVKVNKRLLWSANYVNNEKSPSSSRVSFFGIFTYYGDQKILKSVHT